jgi:hypothetical protein
LPKQISYDEENRKSSNNNNEFSVLGNVNPKKVCLGTNLSSYTFDFPTLSNPSVSRYMTETLEPSTSISTGVPQIHIPAIIKKQNEQ